MKTRSQNFLDTEQLEWKQAGEGIRRQIMGYDGQLMMVKVEFEKDAVGYEHSHYHSQSTYVASGVFEVYIKGKKMVLKAGEGFYTEPDTVHGVVCLEEGILIDTFSPLRAEFLNR